MQQIHVVDSHTAGEPTRVVVEGGPPLGTGPLAERARRFRDDFDHYRRVVVNEPRGSDVLVGALLCEPHAPDCAAGVLFFNNVGPLGMCGHGTIGLVETLRHLGRITPGMLKIDTAVGVVSAQLHSDGRVSIQNVPSYRHAADVAIDVPGVGPVMGDVAWGGNWFFLVQAGGPAELRFTETDQLTEVAWKIRQSINAAGYPEVDHIELFAPPGDDSANSRNFVLCPGKAYDRSPCGTGTSAKLACLAARGKLQAGETWVQESILGTRFEASFNWQDEQRNTIIPTITGRAYITAESQLLIDEADPFAWGIDVRSSH